jgi:hypothetical protein
LSHELGILLQYTGIVVGIFLVFMVLVCVILIALVSFDWSSNEKRKKRPGGGTSLTRTWNIVLIGKENAEYISPPLFLTLS